MGERKHRDKITERELLVMVGVAHGVRAADIARELDISPATVRTHVENAKIALGVHTRAHAVYKLVKDGLIA